MTDHDAIARLDDRRRHLELLAEALRGGEASLELPDEIADFGSYRDNVGSYRLRVLQQTIEPATPPPMSASIHALFVPIEARRINLVVERTYPGALPDLQRERRFRQQVMREQPHATGTAEVAHRFVGRVAAGTEADHTTLDSPEAREVERLVYSVDSPSATQTTSLLAARAIAAALGLHDEPQPLGEADAEVLDLSDDGERLDNIPSSGATHLPPDVTVELAAERLGGGMLDEEASLDSPAGVVDRQIESATALRSRLGAGRPTPSDGMSAFVYDEWDYHRAAYLRRWCTVLERRLTGDNSAYLNSLRREHRDVSVRVRRLLGATKALAWQRVRRVDDGPELDVDAVITERVDRRAGHGVDGRVHQRGERLRREVAVAFLIDLSSSTSSPAKPVPLPSFDPDEVDDMGPYLRGWGFPGPTLDEPTADTVLDIAKAAVTLTADALALLGDSYAVYGFSGRGRSNVEFHVAKDFSDRASVRSWAAIAAMKPLGYTRMGPAIRHATSKLERQPQAVRMLIVVSDGYPQDEDYGPSRSDSDYGLHDTARALEEAARLGISTFCITVDPAGNDYLRRMCAPDRYLVIDDVSVLPTELARVYRTLRSAASKEPTRAGARVRSVAASDGAGDNRGVVTGGILEDAATARG